jgi:hypothetical protein
MHRATCRILLLLAALLGGNAFAQQELAGTWQGKLAIDANTSLTIQFIFTKKPDGTYSAVLNSPDNGGIKNVAASAVKWNAGALSLQVPSLSGAYAGTLKDGKLDGKWTQEGQALPLVLSTYEKPVIAKADMDKLAGTWHGPAKVLAATVTFVYRFRVDEKGELKGTIAVVERGNTEAPMSDIEFANDKLTFKLPQVSGEYSGTLANGTLQGFWKQPSPGMPPGGYPVSLKKGDFALPVYPLNNISSPAMAALTATWKGTLKVPNAPKPLTIQLVFGYNGNGQYLGHLDSPDQGAKGIPVNAATFDKNKLTVKIDALRGEYVAELSGNTFKGTWTQAGNALPLDLVKQ